MKFLKYLQLAFQNGEEAKTLAAARQISMMNLLFTIRRSWQQAVQEHLAWRDKIAARKKVSDDLFTITPEFGPFH